MKNIIHLKFLQLKRIFLLGPVPLLVIEVLLFGYLNEIPLNAKDSTLWDVFLLVQMVCIFLFIWFQILDFFPFYDSGVSEIARRYSYKILIMWNRFSMLLFLAAVAPIMVKVSVMDNRYCMSWIVLIIQLLEIRIIFTWLMYFKLPVFSSSALCFLYILISWYQCYYSDLSVILYRKFPQFLETKWYVLHLIFCLLGCLGLERRVRRCNSSS